MERISIFNYEAFYLDFLEGNLNEEDTALLFAFLDKHPELKEEDDFLEMLTFEGEVTLDPSFVSDLKKTDTLYHAITPNNIEDFIIADLEGQLSTAKKEELTTFLQANNKYVALAETYSKVKVTPNLDEVYSDKAMLKRKSTIVLWPYVSAAAGLILIIWILTWMGNSSNTELLLPQLAKKNPSEKTQEDKKNAALPQSDVQTDVVYTANTGITRKDKVQPREERMEIVRPELKRSYSVAALNNLDRIEPIAPTLITPKTNSNPSEADYEVLAFNKMKNPVKPITDKLSSMTKTELDFRAAKPTERKSGGIYIKIGKFQFSKQKRQ